MNKRKIPSLIPVLVLTLITIVIWVSLDIYRAFRKPTEVSVPANVSQPITPTLDQSVIEQIESRTYLNDSQVPDNIIVNSSPTPAAKVTPKPTIVPTAQPANASGSGTAL